MDNDQNQQKSVPESQPPASPQNPAPLLSNDKNGMLFGIAATVLILGTIAIAVLVFIRYQRANTLERERVMKEQAEVQQKKAAEELAKKVDAQCADEALQYFANNNKTLPSGWSGKTEGSQFARSHTNSVSGHCLLGVKFPQANDVGIEQGTFVVFDVKTDVEVGRYGYGTTLEDGTDPNAKAREDIERLMSE